MARKKKTASGGGDGGGWIVTFSDLMTLLLTFFVLLLSMSSMDSAKLQQVSSFESGMTIMSLGSGGRVPERIRLINEIIRHPDFLRENERRIKDLLFPDDLLPREMLRSTLDENLRVLENPEGVVIVLTGDLLFQPGSHTLDSQGRALLQALTPVIQSVNSDVNISGHTDNQPGRSVSGDDLSALRAMAALEYFLQEGLSPERFSISAFGADRPMADNAVAGGQAQNRRVEILLKTTNRLSGY